MRSASIYEADFSCQRGPVSKNIFAVGLVVVVAAVVVVYALLLLGIYTNEPESAGADVDVDSTGPGMHSWWDYVM